MHPVIKWISAHTLLLGLAIIIVSVSKVNIYSCADTTSDNLFYSRSKVVICIEKEFQALNIKVGKGPEDDLDPDVVRDVTRCGTTIQISKFVTALLSLNKKIEWHLLGEEV